MACRAAEGDLREQMVAGRRLDRDISGQEVALSQAAATLSSMNRKEAHAVLDRILDIWESEPALSQTIVAFDADTVVRGARMYPKATPQTELMVLLRTSSPVFDSTFRQHVENHGTLPQTEELSDGIRHFVARELPPNAN